MLFLPLRWTERIDDCRANAMVVPTGWYDIQSLNRYKISRTITRYNASVLV
ncbi:MAG: hypothetical protein H2174_09930 [Vampirovibrio sp.]|nr:hypothetical protein [Vampirovibrio sp.]